MEWFWTVATSIIHVAYVFFSISALILVFRCFYDPGFQWNRKKAILILLAGVVGAALELVPQSAVRIVLDIVLFAGKTVIVIYDYQGKRLRGATQFIWLSLIFESCMNTVYTAILLYAFPQLVSLDQFFALSAEEIMAMEASQKFVNITYFLFAILYGIVFLLLYFQVEKKGICLYSGKKRPAFLVGYSVGMLLYTFAVFLLDALGSGPTSLLGITSMLALSLLPICYYYLRISGYYQERTAVQQTYIEAELNHFQQYQRTQEETARFRHDIKNNLLCVNDLLQQGKNEEASAYLRELLQSVERLSGKYVTGDSLLDSIVAVKARIMQEDQISFALDGMLAGGIPWKSIDICNVFANALDNAVEACRKLPPEKRHIAMNVKSTPQFWFVTIENPVQEAVDTGKLFQKKGGYTSKENATQHGIGTYTMKHTVESYGDMLNAECTDGVFRLEIMIDKKTLSQGEPLAEEGVFVQN